MNRVAGFFKKYWGRSLLLAVSALVIGGYFLLRPMKGLMNFLIRWVTTPVKRGMAWACSILPFSMAELCWAVGIGGGLFLLVQTIVFLFRRKGKLELLCRRLLALTAAGAAIYAAFCLFWGINYYGDSFSDLSGLTPEPVSVEELEATALWFVGQVNACSDLVPRDEEGLFSVSRDEILDFHQELYQGVSAEYPFLDSRLPRPKKMFFSRIMSYLDFTGFFFPFTGEANLNAQSPVCFFPATVAHEMAHQKNIAPEQDANFVAVAACLDSGNLAFTYSGALMGYVHLTNALYSVDRQRWEAVSAVLAESARRDLSSNNAYWAQFDTPVNTVSQSVYNTFLQSHGQELGIRSYGACVDLLVARYFPETEQP